MSNVAIQSNTPLQVQTTIVPAQVGTVPGYATMQISGLVLICEAATSQVLCKMDGGGFFPINSGFVVPSAAGFTKLTFQNTTANAITVTIYAGVAGVNYLGTNASKDVSSFAHGTADQALAANATINVPGNLNGFQRKQIIITNFDVNGNYLVVTDNAGLTVDIIPALQSHTYDTDAFLIVKASGGAVSRVVVGEIYYAS